MRKCELKNVQQMVDSLTHWVWKVECLGQVLQNTLSGGEVAYEIEYSILAGILNENIKNVTQKLNKIDRYLIRLGSRT